MSVASVKKKTGYIMFEIAGEADFHPLRVVGFTDKANDSSTINTFGCGFKLAVTAALRLGIDLIVCLGREKVTFKTQGRHIHGKTVRQLVFVREFPDGEIEELQTSLTLDFGAKHWDRPWVVYREVLANCYDVDPQGYKVASGVEPHSRDGFTRVFVQVTDEILELHRNMERCSEQERNVMLRCEDHPGLGECRSEDARADDG